MEVVPANDDSPIHLGTVACSSNNSTSDGNSSSEWALLVNVGTWKGIDINRLSSMPKQNITTSIHHYCLLKYFTALLTKYQIY